MNPTATDQPQPLWTEAWPTTAVRPDLLAEDDPDPSPAAALGRSHRLVWQVATPGAPVLRNLDNLLTDLGHDHDVRVEVVAHGEGLGLVGDGVIAPQQAAALRRAGVRLVACATSMRRWGLHPHQLAPGTRIVSSGVGHLLRRQHQGWAYLRA
ncbi:DsrE family protein [uncultured Pseudokineococcus sp.]|uniref:DsrE family protein n=1 Tax=uncultured Pseudokineococcus sp. TaxID=1642928 RepID=UPI00261B106D|nr:DsrE family protein [uncultured Pseudokineococcus sp.]